MGDNDGHRWDDDQLMTLLTGPLDDPDAYCAEASTSAAPNGQTAELSLENIVAAGQAAFGWLDVVVTLRTLARRLGPAAGASAGCEPGRFPTGSTTT